MKTLLSSLACAALLVTMAAPAQAQRQKLELNVDVIMSDTVCGASYQLGDNRKLDFRINAQNGNVDIAVQNLPADIVNAGRDRENVPITLIFNNDFRTTADVGVFRAGFTYRAMAYWSDNAEGIAVLDRLENVETISVEIDGTNYGIATSKPTPDIGHIYIINCLEDLRG